MANQFSFHNFASTVLWPAMSNAFASVARGIICASTVLLTVSHVSAWQTTSGAAGIGEPCIPNAGSGGHDASNYAITNRVERNPPWIASGKTTTVEGVGHCYARTTDLQRLATAMSWEDLRTFFASG